MASNFEGVSLAATLAAQAAKKVAEKASLQAGNAATDVKAPATTTAAQSSVRKPPPVPKREPIAQTQDTTSFSQAQPKAETNVQTPDPGDTVSLKAPIKPSPVPKRTPIASTTLDSPPPVPPRKQTISPPKETSGTAQTPLKGDAAEEAFLAKWQADPNNRGKKLPSELQGVADRARIKQLNKQIEETEAQIAELEKQGLQSIAKAQKSTLEMWINGRIQLQINAPLDTPASSVAATSGRKSLAGRLLEKTGIRKSSDSLQNSQ